METHLPGLRVITLTRLVAACIFAVLSQAHAAGTAVEFYHSALGHYFMTASGAEAAAIDAGAAGAGWTRTGSTYGVWTSGSEANALEPVCRFYGTPGKGPNSHFYTVDAAECAAVRLDPGWTYEGAAFHARTPQAGTCAAVDIPVYRAYNDRAAVNDSNHRFMTDATTYAQMIAAGWRGEGVVLCAPAPTAKTGDFLTFTLNTQDFSYPELSIATITRVVALHEQYKVPVDIYLTETLVDAYPAQAPSLFEKMKTSPYVSLNYHIRPPKPYYTGYDWLGVTGMPYASQYATIMNYETHGLDLATGQPTAQAGGFGKLGALRGTPGIIAAFQTDASEIQAASDVFRDLGARFTIVHGRIANLGDTQFGLYLRPEHTDMKLFEHAGESVPALLDAAFVSAHQSTGAKTPYVVGVKMHDNDFFAVDSAWTTVYIQGGRRQPTWNTSLKSALLPIADQNAMWTLYEAALAYAAANRARVGSINAPQMQGLVAAGATTPKVYLSGTMHIETSPVNWPNPDALIQFFTRATVAGRVGAQTTGMRWSVGADIGWLQGEPRAAEVIRATEALGVQWDVHAHAAADRPVVAAAIGAAGGHPDTVASGLIYTEIDGLRNASTSSTGYRWQAQTLWGIVLTDGHVAGADDLSFGLWRPRSSADFLSHDPAGNLVAVGGGMRDLTNAETFANLLAQGGVWAPVYSATVYVVPKTLALYNSTSGIDAIEAWASRMGALPTVKWATIAETAQAWIAAGEVPSRITSLPAAGGRN